MHTEARKPPNSMIPPPSSHATSHLRPRFEGTFLCSTFCSNAELPCSQTRALRNGPDWCISSRIQLIRVNNGKLVLADSMQEQQYCFEGH
jgi:hypothetical protein